MTLVLFDIDGTLLHSNGCGSVATRLAMQQVFGTVGALDQFRFGGKTDWNMLIETLDGLVSPEFIQEKLAEYDVVLADHLAAIINEYQVRPCLGADVLVHALQEQPHITKAILTANMPRSAWIKLRTAGYQEAFFEFGVFGSEAPTRTDLAPLALERAKSLSRLKGDRVIIIGDTPDDIACARAINATVVSVATGRYSTEQLAPYEPDVLLENLADTPALLELIAG